MNKVSAPRQPIIAAIKKHLNDENWRMLDSIMIAADNYNIPKRMRLQGWLGVAEYRLKGNKTAEAVDAYNRARILNPTDEKILGKLFGSLASIRSHLQTNHVWIRIFNCFRHRLMSDFGPSNLNRN